MEFINFDVLSDFKKAAVLYKVFSSGAGPVRYFVDVLVFNATTQTYKITTHEQTLPLTHIFLLNSTEAYLFNEQTFSKVSLVSSTLASI